LQELVQGKLTNAETAEIAMSLNSLGKYTVTQSSQIN
jgi:hypothetical protein